MGDTARLQRALGYQFRNQELLDLALTHRSLGGHNNERLEFLGDSILNHIIAEALYQRLPSSREGEMSRMRASLVKGETLAELAIELDLGAYLKLGSGERKSGGHRRKSILADALEAVAGAILLDSDVVQCRNTVLGWFGGRLQLLSPGSAEKDPKTRLQELLQARNCPLPEYQLFSVADEDHAQQFHVACVLTKLGHTFEGEGGSRRKAEQDAAAKALEKLSDHAF
jgi:ribonuclease-3